jgi:predicted AlkP superfamily phosphohydrolase/phosphomutase
MRMKLAPLIKGGVRRIDPWNIRKKFLTSVKRDPGRVEAYSFLNCVDWSKTTAYAASNTEQGIYINLAGREPSGIVKPGKEWDEARTELIKKLENLEHPETGEKLVSRVFKKEEIYAGPHLSRAPDIVFFLKEGEYLADVQPVTRLLQEPNWKTGSGTHRMEGILIACGNDIQKGAYVSGARIIDLAPTILYLMGETIPADMEGEVLTDIVNKEFVRKHTPQYAEASNENYIHGTQEAELNEKDAMRLKEQLKGLGYL